MPASYAASSSPSIRRSVSSVLALFSLLLLCLVSGSSASTPIALDCSGGSTNSTYDSMTSAGGVACRFDASDCSNNTKPFLWAPVESYFLDGASASDKVAAPCFGNLVSGVRSIHRYSYSLGLYAEGQLPWEEETQAYIVRTTDGAILATTGITNLESVVNFTSTTENQVFVMADFGDSDVPTLDPAITYALYFCFSPNTTYDSDVYAVGLFQKASATTDENHVASCSSFTTAASTYPCFTSFDQAADSGVGNEFLTLIEFGCPPASSTSTPSPTTTPSASPTITPSPSSSPSNSPESSPSPTSTASPSATTSATTTPSPLPTITSSPSTSPSHSPVVQSSPSSSPAIPYEPVPGVVTTIEAFNMTLSTNSTSANALPVKVDFGGFTDSSGNPISYGDVETHQEMSGSNPVVEVVASVGNCTFTTRTVVQAQPQSYAFGGVTFTPPSGSAKSVIKFDGPFPFGSGNVFTLSNLLSAGPNAQVVGYETKVRYPAAKMTTYLVHFQSTTDSKKSTLYASFFDVAMVDGALQSITHSLSVDDDGTTAKVTLTFPRFTNALLYDPVTTLVAAAATTTDPSPPAGGNTGGSSSGSSSSDLGLAVGIAAAVGGGLLFLALVVVLAGVAYFIYTKRKGSEPVKIFLTDDI